MVALDFIRGINLHDIAQLIKDTLVDFCKQNRKSLWVPSVQPEVPDILPTLALNINGNIAEA